MAEASRLRTLRDAVARRSCAPGDTDEDRNRKAHFALAVALLVPAGIVWGVVYLALGAPTAAVPAFVFAVLAGLDGAVLARTRAFRPFQVVALLLLVAAPVAVHVALGGFVASSAVVLWAFLAPLLATVYSPRREAVLWLALFLAVVAAAAVVDDRLAGVDALGPTAVTTLFAMNVGGVSTVAFVVLGSFVRAREELRALEVAYLEQSILLRQREKLATLGTLAAGVAHELNNPAAAVQRAADQLTPSLVALRDHALRLAGAVDPAPADDGASRAPVSAVAIARTEEALEEWLADRGLEDAWALAPVLADGGIDVEHLAALSAGADERDLAAVIAVVAHGQAALTTSGDVARAARQMSEIVAALRSYSYVDRGTWHAADVTEGIESTLVLLRAKLRDVEVHTEYEPDLPPIEVRGRELNQVWTNIVDNAVHATGGRGRLAVRAGRHGDGVVVEITDDGPGIDADHVGRVFDPFFTTKDPGVGTGLGLSISHSIVERVHGGRMTVSSRPGATTFRVELPRHRPPDAAPDDGA